MKFQISILIKQSLNGILATHALHLEYLTWVVILLMIQSLLRVTLLLRINFRSAVIHFTC